MVGWILLRTLVQLEHLAVLIIKLIYHVFLQTEKKQNIVEKPLTTSGVPDQTSTKIKTMAFFLLLSTLFTLST